MHGGGVILSGIGIHVHADDLGNSVVDDISVTVESSCTITSGGGSYSGTVNNLVTTEFPASTITSVCNDASGYALYAVGYSGDTYTGGNNNKMLAGAGANYNIATNTSGSSSYWAMKLAKGTSSASDANLSITNSFDNYHTVPATFTKVASYTSATSTSGVSVDPTYKVYINGSQPAGTYTGKVKYVLVHPNSQTVGTYSINYYANGGSGTMTAETGLYNFEDHTIKASTFTPPTGYQLAGWCTTNTAGSYACDGTSYPAGGTIPANTVAVSGVLSLYAYWEISIIDFTIEDVAYQAREGMTWGDWVQSEYNTGSFVASGSNVYENQSAYRRVTRDSGSCADVRPSETIIDSFAYEFRYPGPC